MSYLNDYLKVIPAVDALRIQENIADNQEVLSIQNINEKEYEALLKQLSEESTLFTELVPLGKEIKADDFNLFYSNVLLDLARLFPEQNSIEQAAINYDQIHQGYLEELRKEADGLKRQIEKMKAQQKGESGLLLHSFSFEPEEKEAHVERHSEETAYLYTDRNGLPLEPAQSERLFHTYYLSLSKQSEQSLLESEDGRTTARLEVIYESPYTLTNQNQNYTIEKAIDGNPNTFWFNVALKPKNDPDSVSISPRKGN